MNVGKGKTLLVCSVNARQVKFRMGRSVVVSGTIGSVGWTPVLKAEGRWFRFCAMHIFSSLVYCIVVVG